MTHEVPELEYEFNSLEPHIDARTMEIHHDKHHAAYVANLNKALEKHPELQDKTVEDLLKGLENIPEDIQTAVRNNGGGHANHTMFWTLLKKDVPVSGTFVDAINAKWGSLETFKEEFTKAAMTRFGSGWAWLVYSNGELEVMSTANQDSPLSEGKVPLLGLDCWEHSYYLHYQNKRPDYVKAFWNVVNWEQVETNFLTANK